MIFDLDKYTYWVDSSDPRFIDELIWREMYARIGHIFHIIQMVEYNLANIIAIGEFEKENKTIFRLDDIERIRGKIDKKHKRISKSTFGQLKSMTKKCPYLSDIDQQSLVAFVDYRNYLAHECFKDKLLKNELDSLEKIDEFIDALNDYEEEIVCLNDHLVEIFKTKNIQSVMLAPGHSNGC